MLAPEDIAGIGKADINEIINSFLNKLREVSQQFVKLSVAKRKGKTIPQKQSAKFKKARQHLSDYRMNLMKQYTGKLIHDNETDSDFVLRFSV